ncbi:MAG TPA: right-handed parallel beta-helix repeat-containing protein [Rhodanobacteraceae bacterium]|nr:right-handed parallel beta-helix repeat-containing protein [Rhodanobacteraceae bacterium]
MRLLPIALLLALAVGPAAAATFNVNKLDVDLPDANPGDGTCHVASGEDCTLRAAIMETNANAGADTIIVPSAAHIVLGIPGRNEDAGATGDLDITSALTITTPLISNAERATIDAGGIDRVFDIAGTGDITLQNLDLTGGLANDAIYPWGGAIKVDGSGNLTIAHCEIHDNLANGGGAIDTTPGDRGVTIRSSYLHDNTAADLGHGGPEGSAILAGHSGSSGYLYLVNSTVSNNHGPGTSSHAIFSSSLLIIHNCTLDGNLPAAIEASNASVELASVTISGAISITCSPPPMAVTPASCAT